MTEFHTSSYGFAYYFKYFSFCIIRMCAVYSLIRPELQYVLKMKLNRRKSEWSCSYRNISFFFIYFFIGILHFLPNWHKTPKTFCLFSLSLFHLSFFHSLLKRKQVASRCIKRHYFQFSYFLNIVFFFFFGNFCAKTAKRIAYRYWEHFFNFFRSFNRNGIGHTFDNNNDVSIRLMSATYLVGFGVREKCKEKRNNCLRNLIALPKMKAIRKTTA